jgi:hypothetical protein
VEFDGTEYNRIHFADPLRKGIIDLVFIGYPGNYDTDRVEKAMDKVMALIDKHRPLTIDSIKARIEHIAQESKIKGGP